jgi:hypothetical protein
VCGGRVLLAVSLLFRRLSRNGRLLEPNVYRTCIWMCSVRLDGSSTLPVFHDDGRCAATESDFTPTQSRSLSKVRPGTSQSRDAQRRGQRSATYLDGSEFHAIAVC